MKKITKIKSFIDLEKEERYINEMNKKGWKLEYVQLGCIFKFTQSEPDEYFTSIYATDKSEVLQMTSAAILSGYENIPHTLDGKGNFLYLTGRKGRVDGNFISDNENRRNHCKQLSIFYGSSALVCIVTAILALVVLICCMPTVIKAIEQWELYCEYHSGLFTSLFIATGFVSVCPIILCIYSALLSRLYLKTKKQYDMLDSDMRLYE